MGWPANRCGEPVSLGKPWPWPAPSVSLTAGPWLLAEALAGLEPEPKCPRPPELAIIQTELSGSLSLKFFLTSSTSRSLVSVQVR